MQRTLSRIALAVGLLAGAIAAPQAMADAPMVKTQAPGFYRLMVGDFEVTAISDGTVKLPMLKLMNNQPPEKIAEALKRGFLKEMVETSVNTYLINTGSKLVLVDTGAAGLFGPTLGNLLANLKAAGYQPEQVDEIYITHMHCANAKFGLDIVFAQAVHEFVAGRNTLCQGRLAHGILGVRQHFGCYLGQFRKGLHDGALGFVDLVKHGLKPLKLLHCSNITVVL